MRSIAVLLSIFVVFGMVRAQDPTASASPTPSPTSAPENVLPDQDKADFQAAVKIQDPAKREKALLDLIETYPDSVLLMQARGLVSAARAEMAAKAIDAGDKDRGIELFKSAIREAPEPVSDKLFTGVLLQIPNNLYFLGYREESFEIAGLIEKKVYDDAKKLIGLATFQAAVENSAAAKQLASRAIELDPGLPAAHQTLGLALRLGFDLEGAEKSYEKALELDPGSNVSRRSLADIKRALGKADDAVKLYDEIIASDPSDANAGTGRTLALFDAGRVAEAESALETLLSVNPKNLVLLTGAAYWYAANSEPDKAIDLANRALAAEPRYTWSYIALARGLMAEQKPLEAERALVAALRYGNYPTITYEIAASRIAAGFYGEASQALSANFSVADGKLETKLGGRIDRTGENFVDLISPERQASIFEPRSADDPARADRLKRLLEFTSALEAGNSEEPVGAAAEKFVEGTDPMRTHRLIFAASRMLDKDVALKKVSEFAREAVATVDDSLTIKSPAAAVMADELYANRQAAFASGKAVVVPDIPVDVLSKVLRGKIEELDGWSAFKLGENEQALIHLKRAISILPTDSVWARSVYWKIGTVYEKSEQNELALDNYIASYRSGGPNDAQKSAIEAFYKKLNGSLDGLDARLKSAPARTDAASLLLKDPGPGDPTISPATVEGGPAKPLDGSGVPEAEPKADRKVDDPEANNVERQNDDRSLPVTKDGGSSVDSSDDQSLKESDASPKPKETSISPKMLEDIERANREAMDRTVIEPPKASASPEPLPDGESVDKGKVSAGKPEDDSQRSDGTAEVPSQPEDATPRSRERTVTPPGGASTSSRPRVVPKGRERLAGASEEDKNSAPCSVVLSQESASIVAGGSTGVVVGLDGVKGAFRLKASSDSPEDIKVAVDRSIEIGSGRATFILTSISSKTGVFNVSFESSCGKKDFQVTVR